MPAIPPQLVDALSSAGDSVRAHAARQIYDTGIAPALVIANKWQQDSELADLLSAPTLRATAGLAVFPAAFAKIRAAAGKPALAEVPPDQDAEEFELHFPDAVALDILTSKDPAGDGAIARYLRKFGEGIQQVEFRCKNVDRATEILKTVFAVTPVYPATRPGANNTRINFFLVAAENEKLLIELYEL
jgi:hypothetical protein